MERHGENAPGWSLPLLYVVGAVILAFVFPRLESRFFADLVSPISSDSAIAIFSSVAAGMMSLTAIVFSLVFVMTQFSAITYSPRLALALARDPLLFHGIGIFTATFIYALVALAWVNRGNTGRVPFLTTANVLLLVIASVFVLSRLVRRVSLLRITDVLNLVGNMGRTTAEKTYPPITLDVRLAPHALEPDLPPIRHTMVHEGVPRVIESLQVAALVEEARRAGVVVEVVAAVGDTVITGTPILHVRSATATHPLPQLLRYVRLSSERTFKQDPRYALRILVDIAIKGLSPAINDPTTAVQALDYIEDLLTCIGRRHLTDGYVRDSSHGLRLVYPAPTWEDLVALALDEIRIYGSDSVQVMRRIRALLHDLLRQLHAERHPALRAQLARVDESVLRKFPSLEDLHEAQGEDRQGLGMSRRTNAKVVTM